MATRGSVDSNPGQSAFPGRGRICHKELLRMHRMMQWQVGKLQVHAHIDSTGHAQTNCPVMVCKSCLIKYCHLMCRLFSRRGGALCALGDTDEIAGAWDQTVQHRQKRRCRQRQILLTPCEIWLCNGCKIVEQCRVAPSPDRERRGRRARQQCSRRDKQLHQLMQGDTMLCLQRCGLFRLQHEPV